MHTVLLYQTGVLILLRTVHAYTHAVGLLVTLDGLKDKDDIPHILIIGGALLSFAYIVSIYSGRLTTLSLAAVQCSHCNTRHTVISGCSVFTLQYMAYSD